MLLSSDQMNSMAAQSYLQVKQEAQKKNALDRNAQEVARVKEVARRLTPQTAVFRSDAPKWAWEVHVISSDELNAYCMPGGKIMFYSAIIEKLNLTDAEIAAIMGHEISHALREHGRERMSEQVATSFGIEAIFALGGFNPQYQGLANSATEVAIGLPHSRTQESEADQMGLELMARAGYNPAEAVNLWKKMAASGGNKPPEILSTHPADETRIKNIESLLPRVTPLYQATLRK